MGPHSLILLNTRTSSRLEMNCGVSDRITNRELTDLFDDISMILHVLDPHINGIKSMTAICEGASLTDPRLYNTVDEKWYVHPSPGFKTYERMYWLHYVRNFKSRHQKWYNSNGEPYERKNLITLFADSKPTGRMIVTEQALRLELQKLPYIAISSQYVHTFDKDGEIAKQLHTKNKYVSRNGVILRVV